MIPRPPRSTRTYTRIPDTTLFRSLMRKMQVWERYPWPNLRPRTNPSRSLSRSTQTGGSITQKRQATSRWIFRSEEHTSELQSLLPIPYAVSSLKYKTHTHTRASTTDRERPQMTHDLSYSPP